MEGLIEPPSNPLDINIDKVAKSYSDFLKIPILSAASFTQDTADLLNVHTEWTYDDVISKEKSSFVQNHSIVKSSVLANTLVIASSMPVPYDVKLTCFSNAGSKKAVLTTFADATNKKTEENENRELLRIYDNEMLLKTVDLKKLDKHKEIYTLKSQWGSTMAWSQDGTKLAYMAEKKTPKVEPFLEPKGFTHVTCDQIDDSRKGEEFAFRQSWGEQLTESHESVVVIFDLYTEEFKVIELPDKLFPSDLQWVNNSSIVGTGYVHCEWRLGLIYCTNRESRIFQIGIDGNNFRYLSNPGKSAFSPRVNPKSEFLIWQEREVRGPHDKSREIMGLKIEDQLEAPRILYPTNPQTLIPVYQNFPFQCWSLDGSKYFVVTPNDVESIMLEFNISTDYRLTRDPLVIRNIDGIHSIGKDYILASRSSTIESPSLLLISIENQKIVPLTKSVRVISRPVNRLIIPGPVSPASFYYGPTGDDVKRNTIPLMVMPHGGPHSVFLDSYIPEIALFLSLGYGVLRLNYIGSTGGTTDTTERLCGKIGVADVQYCQAIVATLLCDEPNLNPTQVVANGGSHGGFLSAHLSSSFPDIYKAVALRNPVTDLLSCVSVSDITDWSYVEMGIKNLPNNTYVPIVKTLEDAKKYMECSPIQYVEAVKGATLLLLGSDDIRVPMSQGMAYYRALLAAGKIAEVRLYKDCHPLQKVPSRFDSTLHTVLWFAKYLKK